MATPNDGMTTGDVQVGDLTVHYREWGTGDPVIALHGWPETSYEWRHVGPRLAAGDRWRVVAPDTRGHGETTATTDGYSRAQLALDVVQFMDALGIDAAPLIGHDWGGIIAFKVAVDHASRVRSWPCSTRSPLGGHSSSTTTTGSWCPASPSVSSTEHAEDFVSTIVGRPPARPLPPPPECPFNMPPELLAARPWASEADVEAYAAPYRAPGEIAATCSYYRSLEFHRVIDDGDEERYEPVSHDEMAARWLAGTAGGDHLDYAIEDRRKTYEGATLWMPSSGVMEAAANDPAMTELPTSFPEPDHAPGPVGTLPL